MNSNTGHMGTGPPGRRSRQAAARGTKAFTLVETVIAFAILVISLLGVSLYFNNAMLFQRFGSEYSIANAAANAVLEYVLTTDVLTLPSMHGGVFTETYSATSPTYSSAMVGASLRGLGGSETGEPYTDANANSKLDWNDSTGSPQFQRDNVYQTGQTGETFTNSNANGVWDPPARCVQVFVANMQCTAFTDTNPATGSAPIVGYRDAGEPYTCRDAAVPPLTLQRPGPAYAGRVFWNDPNPVYNPLLSLSGYVCPNNAVCTSRSIDANRSMQIIIRVNWIGGRGASKFEIRTVRAFY